MSNVMTAVTPGRGAPRISPFGRKLGGKVLTLQFPRKSVLSVVLGSLLNGDLVAESLEALDGAAEGSRSSK